MIIREAKRQDVSDITDMLNDAIATTTATFETTPRPLGEQQAWFEQHDEDTPILVATRDNQVIGWASLSPWSDHCASADTVEISIYVHKAHQGQGIGKHLAHAIIQHAKTRNHHSILARVTQGNTASLHLLQHLGFNPIGTMKEVGIKFGNRLDVHLLQCLLKEQ